VSFGKAIWSYRDNHNIFSKDVDYYQMSRKIDVMDLISWECDRPMPKPGKQA
jgi:hypothetical protein